MRTALPALFLLAACGGSAPAPQTPAPDAPDDGLAAAPQADKAEKACEGIVALSNSGCEFLEGYDHSTCVADLRAAAGDPLTMALADCFVGGPTCASAQSCVDDVMVADMMANAGTDGGGECDQSSPYGATATRFSEAPTTQDRPIEVCMVPGELQWLTRVTCDDGTNPFKTRDGAHDSRVGSVGQGGRCGAIIDLYEVRCPEKTYQVHMDMYACN